MSARNHRKLLIFLSLAAVALTVLLRGPQAMAPDQDEAGRKLRQARLQLWNTPLSTGRCVIEVASFGGGKARLFRAEKDGTVHYAVVETAPRNSLLQPERDWLRVQFGTREAALLGAFRSKEAAMGRAGWLCPPRLRCLPGRPGCTAGSDLASPFETFTRTLVLPSPPAAHSE